MESLAADTLLTTRGIPFQENETFWQLSESILWNSKKLLLCRMFISDKYEILRNVILHSYKWLLYFVIVRWRTCKRKKRCYDIVSTLAKFKKLLFFIKHCYIALILCFKNLQRYYSSTNDSYLLKMALLSEDMNNINISMTN